MMLTLEMDCAISILLYVAENRAVIRLKLFDYCVGTLERKNELLIKLSKANLLQVTKENSEEIEIFSLAQDPRDITLLQILRSVDPTLQVSRSGGKDKHFYHGCEECRNAKDTFQRVQEQVFDIFSRITLADMMGDLRSEDME